jgi:transcriptional regulator with XRE-family HTH domain
MAPMSYSKSELELPRDFGARLRRARRDKGWSQEELAFRSGLHRTYVGSVERAERNLTLLSLWKLSDALGCSLGSLLEP